MVADFTLLAFRESDGDFGGYNVAPPSGACHGDLRSIFCPSVKFLPKATWFIGIVLLAGAVAYLGWLAVRGGGGRLPEGLIQGNGRIEGDQIIVATKVAGRIAELLLREGATVREGEVLVRLDDEQTRARADQLRNQVTALEKQLESEAHNLRALQSELPLMVGSAQSRIVQANARLNKAVSVEAQAAADARRARDLAARGFIDSQRAERAETERAQAADDVAAARQGVVQAEKDLANARLGAERIAAKEHEIGALQARLAQARAGVAEVEAALRDLTIVAPAAGVVTTRMRDRGEVLATGSPILELVDLDRLYLKVYVPEVQIGKVRLGLPARVHVDAFPDQPVPATVRYIASRAEFTPKEVQTPDERTKLVFEVRLYLDENPDRRFTPGLPADAVIRWKDDVPWKKPRW